MNKTAFRNTDPSDLSEEEAEQIARAELANFDRPERQKTASQNDTTSTFLGKSEVVSTVNAPAYEKFPVERLPRLVQDYVSEGAEAIGCDMSMIALPMLSALGATIGTSVRIELKSSWSEPPLVWSCVLGDSGSSKTPAFTYALAPFRRIESSWMQDNQVANDQFQIDKVLYERELASWKKQKSTTDPPPTIPEAAPQRRLIANNITMEALGSLLRDNPKGLLIAVDELSGWLGSFDRYSNGDGDVGHWLSMFNGQSITIDRKTGQTRTLYVPSAAVCITGGIQPRILAEMLGKKHVDNGLAARFLMSFPPRVPKQWTESTVSQSTIDRMRIVVSKLSEYSHEIDEYGNIVSSIVVLSPEAKSSWIDYYNLHNQEQVSLGGSIGSTWSKLECYAGRLALIHHCVRVCSGDTSLDGTLSIDGRSMEDAIAITDWFKNEAKRIYQVSSMSPQKLLEIESLAILKRAGAPVSARDFMRLAGKKIPTSEMAEQVLSNLVAGGFAKSDDIPPGPKGGQPTRRFYCVSG